MKPTELRQMSDEQLARRVHDLREELFKLNLQRQTAQLEKASRLTDLRRDIARAMTILSERRLGLGPTPAAAEPAKPKRTKAKPEMAEAKK